MINDRRMLQHAMGLSRELGNTFFFSPANTAPTVFVGSPVGAAQGFAEASQHELLKKGA